MSGTKCGKCNKEVYFKEQSMFDGVAWHTKCFKCENCNKQLVSGSHTAHKSMPYCQSCYNKLFRLKGYGYGVQNLDSHDMSAAKKAEQKDFSSK